MPAQFVPSFVLLAIYQLFPLALGLSYQKEHRDDPTVYLVDT